MEAEQIRLIDARARERFTYQAEKGDRWRSFAGDVVVGKKWRGDCDDLASTTLDLLGRAGLPLNQRFRLVVDSTGGKHMVGCAVDADGVFHIVGDTFDPCYRAPMPHKPIEYHRLDELTADRKPIWRDGAPWRIKNASV